MEQPEMPPSPDVTPAEAASGVTPPPSPPPEPVADASGGPLPKVELPDTKGAIPIPEQYRLPFMGKVATPTSVPSAAQRQANLDRIKKRRRRRGFLVGLLFGQLVIIGLDLGGEFYLKLHPQITLKANIPVSSIVFLGMAVGAAVMILALVLIYGIMALRGMFGKRPVAAAGRGIKRVVLTTLTLGVTMGVILGTAWFMIPRPKWMDTMQFARDRGLDALQGPKAKLKGWFSPAAKP